MRIAPLLLIAGIGAGVALGQVAQFKASSNLVVVDVVVTDKAGKPMRGLKQGDFTVLEDGKPQKVSVFEFQELSSVNQSRSPNLRWRTN